MTNDNDSAKLVRVLRKQFTKMNDHARTTKIPAMVNAYLIAMVLTDVVANVIEEMDKPE